MVSREQRVSWPHPDTIRKKKENAHKAIPIVSDLFYSFFFFIFLFFCCCDHIEANVSFFLAVTRRMNDGEMYFVSFETFNIFKAPAAEEGLIRMCIASVGHQLSFFHFLLSCFFLFFLAFIFVIGGAFLKSASSANVSLVSRSRLMNTLEDSEISESLLRFRRERRRLLLKTGITL